MGSDMTKFLALETRFNLDSLPALWGAVVRRSAVPEAPDESSGVGL
jgi:hypothetical protein